MAVYHGDVDQIKENIKMKLFMLTNNSVQMTIKFVRPVLVLMLLTVTVAGVPLARSIAGQAQAAGFGTEEVGKVEVVRKELVTINKKSEKNIITYLGDRYGISSEQTLIIGQNGKQIQLGEMLVPCRAEITYIQGKEGRFARRVVVKHAASDASVLFQSDDPR